MKTPKCIVPSNLHDATKSTQNQNTHALLPREKTKKYRRSKNGYQRGSATLPVKFLAGSPGAALPLHPRYS